MKHSYDMDGEIIGPSLPGERIIRWAILAAGLVVGILIGLAL